jgi:carbon storage regulator
MVCDNEAPLAAKELPMLVMTRRKNESIVINDDITIVVVEIRGDKVRLGIEAPKEVPVHRTEVYEAIRRNTTRDYYAPFTSISREPSPWAAEPSPQPAPSAGTIVAEIEAPTRDGLCCPQCQSDDVRIERIKVAYQGIELVRWRECAACGNRFQMLEQVKDL